MIDVKTITILIIEDCFDNRMMYKRFLDTSDTHRCEVFEAASGVLALEMLADGVTPDCILLDYKMPELDGIAFLKKIINGEGFVPYPVVMLTGTDDEKIFDEAAALGVYDFINKGEFTVNLLTRSISHAIQGFARQKDAASGSKELERFSYIAAHDLKSPLNSVKILLEVLNGALSGDHNAEVDKCMGLIERSVDSMSELIETLLTYAKAGVIAEKQEWFSFGETITFLELTLSSLISKSDAVVTVSPMPEIYGSVSAISQLMQNLIENSIKYGGVKQPKINIALLEEHEYWHFTVADNGVGIPSDDVERVFCPLERVENSTESEGTGLGLAICQKIVWAHGGKIWVESELGVGSVFHFTLKKHDRNEIRS